ncbi:PREDICTED: solute carrier family 41 member 1-like [Rhagoletis zephyria]|uniref:solute carrier family 41 member 1-like n=1 Tax=Rhagoletis zephyria TaxID=28612 RepID=UPI00081175EE|nr:PREDICTED: solute carrier family 41 member 1-like [Rhagoletis zephyria]
MVTKWEVFQAVPQLEIMVPAFLGLIGNIETTLASRLSTHANIGTLDTWQGLKTIMTGNMLVVQCQASTVGLFAALASLAMSTIKKKTRQTITLDSALMLASGSVITSIIANSILATVISIVIITARKFRINPDNISTPVAASMGDVCSITILAVIMQTLYQWHNRILNISLIVGLIAFAPIFGYFARQNRFTKSVIYTGWTAILGAVIVEQPGGMVMQDSFEKYRKQPSGHSDESNVDFSAFSQQEGTTAGEQFSLLCWPILGFPIKRHERKDGSSVDVGRSASTSLLHGLHLPGAVQV